jgi:uncharacterized protein YjbI with pentapeptide repeats
MPRADCESAECVRALAGLYAAKAGLFKRRLKASRLRLEAPSWMSQSEPTMIARKQNFLGMRIALDGCSFDECRFDRCHFVFNGYMGVTLTGCAFEACTWEFAGPAANTITFMTALYGGGSRELVEATIRRIRGEEIKPSFDA